MRPFVFGHNDCLSISWSLESLRDGYYHK